MEYLKRLFDTDFISRGDAYRWYSDVLWINVLGDALTVLAYFTIPFALYYFIKRRRDLRHPQIAVLFAMFIFLSGAVHVVAIIGIWEPLYRFEGLVKLVTGAVSLVAAVVLLRTLPDAIKIGSPRQLKDINAELELKTKELAKHNEFLKNLAYATAHDLREPARGVSIHAQMLAQKYSDELSPHVMEELKYLADESRRLYSLIESVINYSYVESEEFKMTTVNLGVVAEQVKRTVGVVIDEAGAALHFGPMPVVKGNERLLNVLLQNIITNSIKFRQTDVPLVVNVTAASKGAFYQLSVTDNGIGFDNRYNQQVFEIFRRLNPVGVYRGSGLGLAICKRIVEMHGGTISATSEPGKGTTITATLPAT